MWTPLGTPWGNHGVALWTRPGRDVDNREFPRMYQV
jgi:hypothetical protein